MLQAEKEDAGTPTHSQLAINCCNYTSRMIPAAKGLHIALH
jgi:hypothetical protein